MRKSRFFSVNQVFLRGFPVYFFFKFAVFEFKIQVFELKIQYGLFA